MSKTKFAIGCLVQWYEIDMVGEYINSLLKTDNLINDDFEVFIDFTLNVNQDLEKIDTSECNMSDIISRFKDLIKEVPNCSYRINEEFIMISDYRRWFLDEYCTKVDVLVQGESDSLLPSQMFTILNHLHNSVKHQTPKYIATFATCKMWDDSWKPLEHIELTDKPLDPYAWYGTRCYMSYEKMIEINSQVQELMVTNVSPHKFNGCGFVISSEVVKSGVNIPKGIFFIDDTALNMMSKKILPNMPQYHIKNVLLVHNREHPNKRNYVLGETGDDLTGRRKSNDWYNVANEYSKINDANIFNPSFKFLTWQDVLNQINKNK